MSKSRWFIAFDEEVTGPGEAIADWDPEECPDVMSRRDCANEYRQTQQRPTSVHPAISRVRMFLQVEGEKFIVGRESILRRVSHGVV